MTPMPQRLPGERVLAYYNRLNEWERLARIEARREAARIDSALSAPRNRVERAVTKQTERDRRSIHDDAQHNPVLARILRRMGDKSKGALSL